MVVDLMDGRELDFDAVHEAMDHELRERVRGEGIEDKQAFLDRYCELHSEHFHELFQPSRVGGGPATIGGENWVDESEG